MLFLQSKKNKMANITLKNNPITTQHVEMSVQTKQGQQIDKKILTNFFNAKLPKHMVPKRITFEKIEGVDYENKCLNK